MSTSQNELRFSTIALWGGLVLVLALVGAVWIEAYYLYLERHEINEKVIEVRVPERDEHFAAQAELLQGYRWIDRENGVVGLPIERAMELVGRGRGRNPQ